MELATIRPIASGRVRGDGRTALAGHETRRQRQQDLPPSWTMAIANGKGYARRIPSMTGRNSLRRRVPHEGPDKRKTLGWNQSVHQEIEPSCLRLS